MSDITVLIPSSVIPAHPSAEVIDETIKSVRDRLPDAEIIVMFDGIRKAQEKRKPYYETYVQNFLQKTKHDPLITPLYFPEHAHQAKMVREALKLVSTRAVLLVEHDTPLTGEIDFEQCLKDLDKFNVIRFSHEAVIPEPHKEFMLDPEPVDGYIRTSQFSARPHLARTEFYRWIIHEYFGPESITFIEDVFYPVVKHYYEFYGPEGWERFRIAIYAPDPENLKRSENLDGRGSDPKYPLQLQYEGATPEGAPNP